MGNFVLFLIGFGLAVAGGITLIAYLNFFPAGITWGEYFHFVSGRIECYFLPTGFVLILIALQRFYKVDNNHSSKV